MACLSFQTPCVPGITRVCVSLDCAAPAKPRPSFPNAACLPPSPKPARSERPQPSHGCVALRDSAAPGRVNRPHTVGRPASPASCSCCRRCGQQSCATVFTCTSEDARPESRAEFVPARKVPADRTEKKNGNNKAHGSGRTRQIGPNLSSVESAPYKIQWNQPT